MSLEAFVGLDHFTPEEFDEPERMDAGFLKRLDEARDIAGVPFKITSSFRIDDTPDEVDSTHEVGFAVDISCPEKAHGRERSAIIRGLLGAGFTRIGVYDRHIHGDMGEHFDPVKFAADVMWWGKSK